MEYTRQQHEERHLRLIRPEVTLFAVMPISVIFDLLKRILEGEVYGLTLNGIVVEGKAGIINKSYIISKVHGFLAGRIRFGRLASRPAPPLYRSLSEPT